MGVLEGKALHAPHVATAAAAIPLLISPCQMGTLSIGKLIHIHLCERLRAPASWPPMAAGAGSRNLSYNYWFSASNQPINLLKPRPRGDRANPISPFDLSIDGRKSPSYPILPTSTPIRLLPAILQPQQVIEGPPLRNGIVQYRRPEYTTGHGTVNAQHLVAPPRNLPPNSPGGSRSPACMPIFPISRTSTARYTREGGKRPTDSTRLGSVLRRA